LRRGGIVKSGLLGDNGKKVMEKRENPEILRNIELKGEIRKK